MRERSAAGHRHDAWPLILAAGGLATIERGKLALTASGRRALIQEPADVVRLLWQRWVSHGVIDEFSRVEAIKGQRSANTLSALKPRRAAVAQALAECLGPAWVSVDDLFSIMRRRGLDPSVERSDRAVWNLYLQHREYGSLGYDGSHDWSILAGRYTLAVIFEYAATLGLLDVRYTDPAGAREDFRDQWGGDDLDALSRYDLVLGTLVEDATSRAARLTPVGLLLVIECDDAATAALIAGDRRVSHLVRALGGRHLGVRPEHEARFRAALVKAGYALAA